MARITNTNIQMRKVSSIAKGFLEADDLWPLIKKLVPDAPKDAIINIWIDVPSGGDWSGEKLEISSLNHIKFTVSWEHADK